MTNVRIVLISLAVVGIASEICIRGTISYAQLSVELTSDFRTWTNNTGKFSIEAKLVSAADGKVKLEKKDGRVVELPAGKLSAADREFIDQLRKAALEESNPFAGGELTQDRKKSKAINDRPPEAIRVNVVGRQRELFGNDWLVDIDPLGESKGPPSVSDKAVYVEGFGKDHGFHDRRDPPVVAFGEPWAAVSVSNPFKEQAILSVVDLAKASVVNSVRLPKEIKVFAIDGNSKTVVTLVKESGRTPGKLEFRHFDRLDRPYKIWETADFFENDGFRPREGSFLPDGKLLTVGENIALWDVDRNQVFYSIKFGRGWMPSSDIAFSPDRKLMAVAHRGSVSLIDVESGKLQGKIERVSSTQAVSISPSGRFLAGLEPSGHVWIWNLQANELAQEFHTDAHQELVWLDDQSLLGDGKYLIDVEYRVCVWQYTTEHHDVVVPLGAGRFLLQRRKGLIGIDLPHQDLSERIADLDPEELLLIKPGDEFAIDFELPFGADEQRRIEDSLAERLNEHGFSVNNASSLLLRGRVKREKRKTVQVREFGFGRGRESITFQANRSIVELVKDGEVIWTSSQYHGPSMIIHRSDDESLQQYADRVSKPTPDFFLSFRMPSDLSTLPGGEPLGKSDIASAGLR